jgi:hypothetical protein
MQALGIEANFRHQLNYGAEAGTEKGPRGKPQAAGLHLRAGAGHGLGPSKRRSAARNAPGAASSDSTYVGLASFFRPET